jgi:lysozyme
MTMGYGLNVSAGISQRAAAVLLQEQVAELDEQLTAFPWYAQLDPARQSVCLDIAYNTGLHGLLAFPAMIAALARKDWMSASIECHVVDPKLANRYAELASLLLNGVPA